MNDSIQQLESQRNSQEAEYTLPSPVTRLIKFLPFFAFISFFILLYIPGTTKFAKMMLRENRPVELLTFIFLVIAGPYSVLLSVKARQHKENIIFFLFYLFLGIALFVIGMEEVSWGQWFLKFKTPETIKAINTQGEFTVHNIGSLSNLTEIFRLLFGLAGLLGIYFSSQKGALRRIGVPTIFIYWFLWFLVLDSINLYNDFYPIEPRFDDIIGRLSELIEMMIGLFSLLYVWFSHKKFKAEWTTKTSLSESVLTYNTPKNWTTV